MLLFYSMLPTHLYASLDARTWPVPPVLRWFKAAGRLSPAEFARTWNTGLGMVLVVDRELVATAKEVLEAEGEKIFEVGQLMRRGEEGAEGGERCILRNVDLWES